jgi:hypothetical protein
VEVVTDKAATYPIVLDELLPAAWHHTDQYANNMDGGAEFVGDADEAVLTVQIAVGAEWRAGRGHGGLAVAAVAASLLPYRGKPVSCRPTTEALTCQEDRVG